MNKIILISPGVFTKKELQAFEDEILENKSITEHYAANFFERYPKFLSIGGYCELLKEEILLNLILCLF